MSQDMMDSTEVSEGKSSCGQDIYNQLPENKAIEDCLANPVIVRKIMEHSWFFELLPLSLVNKLWNYEARSLMRLRGCKVARFSSRHNLTGGPQPCQQLVAFVSGLPKMNVVPFSGLRVYLNGPAHRDVFPPQALLDLSDETLDRLSRTNFTIQLWGKSTLDKFSPFFLLTKKVLENVGRVIETLTISVSNAELMDRIVQDCSSFPNLKILKLKDDDEDHDAIDGLNEPLTNLAKTLVARSPLLQELQTDGILNFDVFGGSTAKLVYTYPVHAPFDEIPENFNVQLRLKAITLEYFGPEFDMERFYEMTPKLLRISCAETLRSIEMDAVLAVPLMCFGIISPNVKDLDLSINFSQLERVQPRILRIFKDFDFTRLLPNLSKVEIHGGYEPEFFLLPDHMNTIIEHADAVLGEPMPDRAVNIKQLKIYSSLTNDNFPFLAQMFPKIEKLEIRGERSEPFGYIWKHWVGLKELRVWLSAEEGSALNLDSVLCGIFPEEVAELREKDEEFLKSVHIVPVMPAITCLKSLRRFTLCYSSSGLEPVLNYLILDGYLEDNDNSSLIFSKVTGLVAFRRCPHIDVTLEARTGDMWNILGVSIWSIWSDLRIGLKTATVAIGQVSGTTPEQEMTIWYHLGN